MNAEKDEQNTVADFLSDGYVLCQGFFSGEQLEELHSNVNRFIHDVLPHLPRETVFFENIDDPSTLKQIQQMGEYDDYFFRLMNQGPVRQMAELLLDGPVVPKNMQYFNKPRVIGKATPPHQDGYYFMLDPCEAVTMWLALDDVDEQNGCIRYIPGSHLKGIRSHSRTQTLGFSQGITDYNDDDHAAEITLLANPGDLSIHHAKMIHRADANRSENHDRRALGFIYYSERAGIDEAAHRVYQKKLKQEMIDAGQV